MNFFDDLKNKKILVVGASQGIGKELCMNLDICGSDIYSLSRNETKLRELTSQIKSKSIICDINDEKQVQEAVEKIEPLDGVCFVSGIVKLIPPNSCTRNLSAFKNGTFCCISKRGVCSPSDWTGPP